MATRTQCTGVQSDIRTDFAIKEGSYRNVKASEHCRPSRQALFSKELSPVQISIVSCKGKDGICEWIVFNSNKELYFYPFEGVGKVPDLKHPLDKRVYKSPTIPVCHDFNPMTRSMEHLDLVVGFSTGPLQYLNPLEKLAVCAFNEDGSIDCSRVTCVKWVPGSENTFVSSHRSGNLYVWTTENHATYKNNSNNTPLNYLTHKNIQDAKICVLKQRNKFSLLFRWTVGHGPINAFAFSPNSVHIAISSQDGFLRIYDFHKQEIYGRMRSYFGGLLCVCWSPDGRYAVTGGEDDLLTVWSFEHRKVVARGEGHQSYINAVAFDPYMTILPNNSTKPSELEGSSSLVQTQAEATSVVTPDVATRKSSTSADTDEIKKIGRHLSVKGTTADENFTTYRLGSVGQDTRLCLWDLSGDSLKMKRLLARGRSRANRQSSRPVSLMAEPGTGGMATTSAKDALSSKEKGRRGRRGSSRDREGEGKEEDEGERGDDSSLLSDHFGSNPDTTKPAEEEDRTRRDLSVPADLYSKESSPSVSLSSTSSVSSKKEKKKKKDKKKDKPLKPHRNTLKEPMRKVMKFVNSGFTNSNSTTTHHHARRLVGTFETCNSDDIALKMVEVNLVEPLVGEKISQERLTALVFREDCILTACQEGFISTWARPGVCMGEEDGGSGSQSSPAINTGINSPKPSTAMDHDSPVKSTVI